MNHSDTRIHIQIGFHRILPSMYFCLHGLSPVFYIGQYIDLYWAQRPSWPDPKSPNPTWGPPRPVHALGTRP